jgi:exodeoxyribonuclease VII small subunit
MTNKKSPSLEEQLQSLEAIVTTMEQGDLPLDKALKEFEKGVSLIKDAQKTLKNAEQKVAILLNDQLEPFANENDQ